MPRPSQIDEQRARLLPIVCEVFSEFGYRGTTTAKLAERCGVQENILYRLWRDKKAMFLAAIDDIFGRRANRWSEILARSSFPEQAADELLAYEVEHQGEFGFYRVVFTALVEVDDPEIRKAIAAMYRSFHQRLCELITAHRGTTTTGAELSVDATAWALIGLGTVSNIVRELKLLGSDRREAMFLEVGNYLINGTSE